MLKRLYYRLLRDYTASKLLAALIASPQRYEYIKDKIDCGELNNHTASDKNITKAIVMADQFVEGIKDRNTLDD